MAMATGDCAAQIIANLSSRAALWHLPFWLPVCYRVDGCPARSQQKDPEEPTPPCPSMPPSRSHQPTGPRQEKKKEVKNSPCKPAALLEANAMHVHSDHPRHSYLFFPPSLRCFTYPTARHALPADKTSRRENER
jgi:hypothetical protein